MNTRLVCLVVLGVLIALGAYAGTTGKIAGKVREAQTGEPVAGVSVLLEGTTIGASTNIDGDFVIVNVPPGTYTVAVSGVGYQKKRYTNVKVSIDFTTRLEAQISSDVISLETVEVQAEAPMVRKDLTSSQTIVDAAAIEALPVESVSQVLTLQAGVVQGADGSLHIRGGRSNEVQYQVNGVSITNPFDNSRTVTIATNAIEELSVVSGTFNAEYGNALSGIVNTVTKEGGGRYHASVSWYTGDKLSTHDDIFLNIADFDPLAIQVAEGTAGGPVPFLEDQVSFFLSGRYDYSRGWYYGLRQHTIYDSVYRSAFDPNDIRIARSGDSALVPMNPSQEYSTTAKLTWTPLATLKIKYDFLYSNADYKYYIHDIKYNPDANYNNLEWGMLNSLEIRHAVTPATFYVVRGSFNVNDYKQYLFPLLDPAGNPLDYHAGMTLDTSVVRPDPRYQPDYKLTRASTYTFYSGGTLNDQYYRRAKTFAAKADLTSQIDANHELKLGVDFRAHELWYENFSILRDSVRYRTPTIPDESTAYHDRSKKTPLEFSAYAQDKMEFESIVLNVGLRYDYFASRSQYSTNVMYPTPNSPTLPASVDPNTLLADAAPKHEFSPRVGISFPITDRGIIHFSYGHFYQMPSFAYLYVNPNFEYSYATGTPTFGNANLNPQQTVTYEIGLQQQLGDNLSINVTGFYKDVRDLLALQQIRVSGDETYYTYVNKDYANIKGVTFSLTKRRTAGDLLGFTLDYTLQVAEGNDTNSDAFFLDLSSGRQTEKVPVYLDWDQTHTLNATVSVGRPNDWNVSMIGRLGTGLPYTPEVTEQTISLTPNSERKPSTSTVDLLVEKTFLVSTFQLTAFIKVFNVFDTLNERYVYNDTGRATYSLLQNKGAAQETDKLAQTVPGLIPASEYFKRPNYYTPPRELRFGLALDF